VQQVLRVDKVVKDRKDILVPRVLKEDKEQLDQQVSKEILVPRELKETQEQQVPVVFKGRKVVPDLKDHKDL
jgi:hypothetical protein